MQLIQTKPRSIKDTVKVSLWILQGEVEKETEVMTNATVTDTREPPCIL